ncbi:MAG: sugar transferase [Pseudomonadota bacterium]
MFADTVHTPMNLMENMPDEGQARSANLARAPQLHAAVPPMVARIRFQIIGALLFAVVLPAIVRYGFDFYKFADASQTNSIIAATLAILTGYYFQRRLVNFPGVLASSYIVPTFFASFAAIILLFFFARIEYARAFIGSSFLLCAVWFYLIYFWTKRIKSAPIGIVPGGASDKLLDTPDMDWIELQNPSVDGIAVSGVAVDLRAQLLPEWERFIAQCALSGLPVFHYKQLRESLTGRLEIEQLSENTLGTLLPNLAYMKVKQFLDFLLALILLPLILMIMAFAAVGILIADGRPIFFKQTRVGFQGRRFTVYKFRTMRVGSSEAPSADPDSALEKAQTKEADERIYGFGTWLRRSRIDELPQIINVLRGEMSWIGPRPEAEVLSEWYERQIPFYSYRHIVYPGISGWAQVNQGHVVAVDAVNEKLHFDFYYIKNYSPWLDILIIMRTIRTVFLGQGAR